MYEIMFIYVLSTNMKIYINNKVQRDKVCKHNNNNY
jgi:hypothetical protein